MNRSTNSIVPDSSNSLSVSVDELEKGLALYSGAGIIALRAQLSDGSMFGGFYTSRTALVDAVVHLDKWKRPTAVWATLNGINLERISLERMGRRQVNSGAYRLGTGEGLSGADIFERRRFVVDLDPVAKGPLTDAQRDPIHSRAYDIMYALLVAGFPTPVLVSSGRGYQLHFRVSIQITAANQDSVTAQFDAVITRLRREFNNRHVDIDPKLTDLPRVIKLPGSVARKGFPRLVQVYGNIPDDWHTNVLTLEKMADYAPPVQVRVYQSEVDRASFDISAYLAMYPDELQLARHQPAEGTPYTHHMESARKWRLACCPFWENHTNDDRGGACIIVKDLGGAPSFVCQHAHCAHLGASALFKKLPGPKAAMLPEVEPPAYAPEYIAEYEKTFFPKHYHLFDEKKAA